MRCARIDAAAGAIDQVDIAARLRACGRARPPPARSQPPATQSVIDRRTNSGSSRRPFAAHSRDRLHAESRARFCERAAVAVGALVAQRRQELMRPDSRDRRAARCMRKPASRARRAAAANASITSSMSLCIHLPRHRVSRRLNGSGDGPITSQPPSCARQRLRCPPKAATPKLCGRRGASWMAGTAPWRAMKAAMRASASRCVVVPEAEAMLGDAAARLDVRRLDAHDAGAADRARGEMREMPVVGEPVDCRVLAHRRHHDAVAGGDRAQRQRPEQMRIGRRAGASGVDLRRPSEDHLAGHGLVRHVPVERREAVEVVARLRRAPASATRRRDRSRVSNTICASRKLSRAPHRKWIRPRRSANAGSANGCRETGRRIGGVLGSRSSARNAVRIGATNRDT